MYPATTKLQLNNTNDARTFRTRTNNQINIHVFISMYEKKPNIFNSSV